MKLEDFLAQLPPGDLWVFGYGSLMWSPGFGYKQKRVARAYGYHRALCILSTRYRGTHRRPGLVVGLCRGGSCWGMAFLIDAARVRATLARLWSREMPRRVYEPRLVLARLRGGRLVRALAFLADPEHPSYVRELGLRGRARLVAQGIGIRGPCVDYIQNTLVHMHHVGVRDPHLERVLHAALALRENQKA
jgi:cation transport protein ChaC